MNEWERMTSNCIVGGVPAKVISEISENDRLDVWNFYQNDRNPGSNR